MNGPKFFFTVAIDASDQCRRYFIGHTGHNLLCLDSEIFVCQHDMPCALKLHSNDRFKQACGILLFKH